MSRVFLSHALVFLILLSTVTIIATVRVKAQGWAGAKVYFRGTLVSEPSPEPDGYRRHEVRVEEILIDGSAYLQIGRVEQIWVRIYGTDLPELVEANVGDRVEVSGTLWDYNKAHTGWKISVSEPFDCLRLILIGAEVEFRGTVISCSPDRIDHEVRIEEILEDPTGKLDVGDIAWVKVSGE